MGYDQLAVEVFAKFWPKLGKCRGIFRHVWRDVMDGKSLTSVSVGWRLYIPAYFFYDFSLTYYGYAYLAGGFRCCGLKVYRNKID